MKKRAFLVLLLFSVLAALCVTGVFAANYGGSCGANVTWSLDTGTGILTISGTGDMKNYSSYSSVPWYSYRSSVKKVVIGNGVTSIGGYAFYNCTFLTSVTIPAGVTSIGQYAFSCCTALTSVTIPGSVTSIGDGAFCDCTSLTSVTIGGSVTSIGDSAFYGCTKLSSVTIPDSVTSIGSIAFYNTGYYNNTSNWKNGVLYIGNHLISANTSLSGAYSIKEGTRTIAGGAFRGCTSLTRVTIPDGVTSIGNYAFDGCSKLTSVIIPAGVTSIGESAFRGCTSLTRVTIPAGVTSIERGAFEGCSSLTSVTIPDSVTSIGVYAFYGCTKLSSITIPDSVTSIERYAFSGCSSLTQINVSSGNKTYTIVDGVLFNKEKTELICYPGGKTGEYTIPAGVTSIGVYAFFNCTSLTSVTIPAGVTSIGESAFYNCSKLTSVTIGDSVTTIGEWAFYYCTSLTHVTIPDSVTSIGVYAFFNCTSLTSVTIPAGVTSIGESAFRGCTSLTSVTIPDSVTSIGRSAFYNCTSLTDVYYNGSETQWGKISIGDNNTPLINATKHFIPESIAVKTLPLKSVYIEGQTPDFTGITLTATYRDSSTETITSGFTLSDVSTETLGVKTVTVTYKGKTTTFDITVLPKPLTSIAVKIMPTKLEYLVAKDALDVTGGVITLYCDDDTQENIAMAAYMVSGFDNTKTGAQTLTVTYGGKTTSFDVTITPKSLTGIEIKTPPAKLRYYKGDAFDATGGVITAYYNNETQEDIDLTPDMISGFDSARAGIQTLTVTYGGKTAEFEVKVSGSDSVMIELTSLPSKLTYLEGKDALDLTGGSLRVIFKDDEPQEIPVTPEMVTGFDNTVPGVQTLTISFLGDLTFFDVTVAARSPASIAVKTLPSKLTYLEGRDALDLTGGVVSVNYDNDTHEDIAMTADMVSGFDNAKPGVQTLTVTYEGKTATFNVTVTPKSVLSIIIKTLPTKLEYLEGKDELDTSGGVITAFYDNDTQGDVKMTNEMVSLIDNMLPGVQTLTVTYEDKTATFDVTITPKTLKSISVSRLPDKTEYLLDTEPFDPAGGLLTLKYDNDTQEDIPLANAGISGFSNASSGERTLTVSYGGKMTFFRVNVVSVFTWRYDITKTSITLTNMPNVGSVYAVFRDGSGKINSIKKMAAGEAAAIADGTAKISVIAVSDEGLPFISSVSLAAVASPIIDENDEGGWTPLF